MNESYRNKEKPFEIKSEEDWKKVNSGWYVKYQCDICGEYHIRHLANKTQIKQRCLNCKNYQNPKTPLIIKTDKEWEKISMGWYVKYQCKVCGLYHTKRVLNKNTDKMNVCISISDSENVNFNQFPYLNEQMPFTINNKYDWAIVRPGWYVKYQCSKCNETHIRKISIESDKGFKCIK